MFMLCKDCNNMDYISILNIFVFVKKKKKTQLVLLLIVYRCVFYHFK